MKVYMVLVSCELDNDTYVDSVYSTYEKASEKVAELNKEFNRHYGGCCGAEIEEMEVDA